MSSVIVYSQEDGQIAVCVPNPKCGLTVEQIAEKDVPSGAPKQICKAEDLPKVDDFFNAWIYDPAAGAVPISIDVEKAHNIWKDRWREARAPIFQRLDSEWMVAMERSDNAAKREVELKKQALRDVTQTPLPPRTPGQSVDDFSNQVKSVWPSVLTD